MGWFRRRKSTEPSVAPEPIVSAAVAAFNALQDREWDRLAEPGTWWTGEQRVAIAAATRRAMDGQNIAVHLPEVAEEAARRVAADAASIRAPDIRRWEAEGLDPLAYVELTGVVCRLAALDISGFGLGREPRPLPTPRPGEPSRRREDAAYITTGWVPTVGPASAPSSLTAVPAEAAAMFDVHGVLYASMDEMFEMQLEREGLNRPQIELVAARTSCLNDCFY